SPAPGPAARLWNRSVLENNQARLYVSSRRAEIAGGRVETRRRAEAMSGALVVTGGGRGIGARIAVGAARAGMPVAILYRTRADSAAAVVREIEAAGGAGVAIAADVGIEADVLRAFDVVDRRFGGVRGLVNNA